MPSERHVRLFRNGKNQALRIPREFEMDASEATIRKKGDRLIIEPVKKKSLPLLVASWDGDLDFPDIPDPHPVDEDIF